MCGDYLGGHHGEHQPVPMMDITHIPDYLNDRNSMCDALTKLTKAQQCEFGEWLVKDLGSEGDDCEVWDILALAFFQCVTAPLDNIARALLRTIGKWEEVGK